jgi:hypothetical protein
MTHVWGMILSNLRTWQMPFKNLEWDQVERYKAGEKTKELVIVDVGLRCSSFDWIST